MSHQVPRASQKTLIQHFQEKPATGSVEQAASMITSFVLLITIHQAVTRCRITGLAHRLDLLAAEAIEHLLAGVAILMSHSSVDAAAADHRCRHGFISQLVFAHESEAIR